MKKKKILSLCLSVVMLLVCFPVTASTPSAFETSEPEDDATDEQAVNNDISTAEEYTTKTLEFVSDEIIGNVEEIPSLREENVKHFRLSNGSYEAISFASAVHRKDINGVWQDIDNSLTLKRVNDKQGYYTEDSRVSFASAFKYGSELFSLNENGYSVSMTPISSGKVTLQDSSAQTPVIKNAQKRSQSLVFNSVESAIQIDNRSSIVYNDIRENTDIEYILDGNNIKENIIVKAKSDSYEYAFKLSLTGLTAELDQVGNILLRDAKTENVKYTIPAPYMYDSNGEYSYDVFYNLVASKDGYMLNVIASDTWINDESREFPVTIDPTLNCRLNGYDSYTSSNSPSSNYGNVENLIVGSAETAYVYVEVPSLPSGATLSTAKLIIYFYYDDKVSGSLLMGAYQIDSMWNETQITHNSSPQISATSLATGVCRVGALAANPGYRNFDITSAVSGWLSGSHENYGIALKKETSTTYTNNRIYVKSSESSNKPYISVQYTYTIPDGVYALRNGYGSTYWMSIENESRYEGALLQHKSSNISPVSSFDRSCLFKISRNAGGGYIIRSMTNNRLSFEISGNEIITKQIAADDEDVPNEDTFSIEWDGYGFLIKPSGSSTYFSMDTTTNQNLILVSSSDSTPKMRWSLVQYAGNHQGGTTLTFPTTWKSVGIVNGTTGEATLTGWSTYVNANNLSMEIKPGYEDLGLVEWDGTQNKLTLTATNIGRIYMNTKILYNDDTVARTGIFDFTVIPTEGTYYIQNVDTGRYADIDGPSTAVGAIIHQWQFHTSDQIKWNVEHVSGGEGYVRLKSPYSNLYMGVDPNNTSNIRQYTANEYTLWLIDRTASGNVKLINKATSETNKVLAAPLNENSNGTDLTQIEYTNNDNNRDEWYLLTKVISCVNYYDSTFSGNAELMQNIAIANEFANTVYARYFNVGIYMDGEATYRTTIADECSLGASEVCNDQACGSGCLANHHKNTKRISNQLYNEPRENDHIYILWTDYEPGTLCAGNSDVHVLEETIASVWGGVRPVFQFYKILGNDADERLACMTNSLVHEIAHVFGMYEAYERVGHDKGGSVCVMERFYWKNSYDFYISVKDRNVHAFCASCEEYMEGLTSNIVIQGNVTNNTSTQDNEG